MKHYADKRITKTSFLDAAFMKHLESALRYALLGVVLREEEKLVLLCEIKTDLVVLCWFKMWKTLIQW